MFHSNKFQIINIEDIRYFVCDMIVEYKQDISFFFQDMQRDSYQMEKNDLAK
jgi:hypothetical protein